MAGLSAKQRAYRRYQWGRMTTPTNPDHLETFILSHELVSALSIQEVLDTYASMHELGIANPPYSRFKIVLGAHQYFLPRQNEVSRWNPATRVELIFTNFNLSTRTSTVTVNFVDDRAPGQVFNMFDLFAQAEEGFTEEDIIISELLSQFWYEALVVLLSTKYVRKTREVNKLARLGIGKEAKKNRANRCLYRTTLSIAKVDEEERTSSSTHTGKPRRPHLRRGHIRNQKWGPGFQFERKIFIEAIFVNMEVSDAEHITGREYYSVIKPAQAKELVP